MLVHDECITCNVHALPTYNVLVDEAGNVVSIKYLGASDIVSVAYGNVRLNSNNRTTPEKTNFWIL
jgi:hypothetical protein